MWTDSYMNLTFGQNKDGFLIQYTFVDNAALAN